MTSDWLLFALAAVLALGWTFVNGQNRRNAAERVRVAESAGRFPRFTRRKLLRLIAPTRLDDRANHALVIAGCILIVVSPVVLGFMVFADMSWWQPPLIALVGSVLGAFAGEFVFNSWGCALPLPDEPNPPQEGDERGSPETAHNQ